MSNHTDFRNEITQLNDDINQGIPLDDKALEFINMFNMDLLNCYRKQKTQFLPGKLGDMFAFTLKGIQTGQADVMFFDVSDKDIVASALLEYITTEILELTREVYRSQIPEDEDEYESSHVIGLENIKEALENDSELSELLVIVSKCKK